MPLARPKKGDKAIGRSRGGLSSKIHALIDGLGMLARFRLTGGHAGDSPEALPLLDELNPASLAADKAYDSNAILQHLESAGIQAVIPSRATRLEQRPLDEHLYASRNLVERFFCRIKQFRRRVATRYDKLSERSHHSLRLPPHSSGCADCQQTLGALTEKALETQMEVLVSSDTQALIEVEHLSHRSRWRCTRHGCGQRVAAKPL